MNFIGGIVKKLDDPSSKPIPTVIYSIAIIYLCILTALVLKTPLIALIQSMLRIPTAIVVLFGVFLVYVLCVFMMSYTFFHEGFLAILFFPLLPALPALLLFEDRQIRKYLEKNKLVQNKHTPVVVVVTYPDRTGWKGWFKPNIMKDELIQVIEYLEAKGRNFSFYLHTSFEEVESIMSDQDVKEVCFFGHGSSHFFRLTSEQELHYCDFDNAKYAKELVHQIHCGDKEGKDHRLIDYVVPIQNQRTCIWFDKLVTGQKIKKELRQRIERLKRGEKEI